MIYKWRHSSVAFFFCITEKILLIEMLIILILNLFDQKHWPKVFLLTCFFYFLFFFCLFSSPSFLCCAYVVDIWAVGCIMAEMVRHKILFPGRDCILELLAAVSGSSRQTKQKPKTQTSIVLFTNASRRDHILWAQPQTFCFVDFCLTPQLLLFTQMH